MNQKKLFIHSIISLFIAFLCLSIFINNADGDININSILNHIRDGWLYFFSASILLIISVYIRSLRWKYLFQSNTSYNTMDLFSGQLIGYFINNVIPVRLGDFAKSYFIAKRTDNKTSYILGSIIMERFLDTIMLFIFMLFVIWHYGLDYFDVLNTSPSDYILIFFSLLVFIYLAYHLSKLIPIKIQNILREIWAGFVGINLRTLGLVICSSIFIWCIYWMNVFLIQLAFPSLGLTLIDCLFILVVSSFIQMIPTGFGAIGVFHLGVESVLIQLGITEYHNFLIMLWLYSYIIYTILGAYYFIKEGKFTLRNLYIDLIKTH